MFIHFFCLCPLGLATKLNFNISKEAYYYGLALFCSLLVKAAKESREARVFTCVRSFAVYTRKGFSSAQYT